MWMNMEELGVVSIWICNKLIKYINAGGQQLPEIPKFPLFYSRPIPEGVNL